ncbi:hypothetical protein J3F83DRAFT_744728 [Trichoderma novae-zelandiae]
MIIPCFLPDFICLNLSPSCFQQAGPSCTITTPVPFQGPHHAYTYPCSALSPRLVHKEGTDIPFLMPMAGEDFIHTPFQERGLKQSLPMPLLLLAELPTAIPILTYTPNHILRGFIKRHIPKILNPIPSKRIVLFCCLPLFPYTLLAHTFFASPPQLYMLFIFLLAVTVTVLVLLLS